ncbi:hypothetical protein Vadar_014874 [Vaccinium darrowii]|uniref:Uncharacterized protein n=1 Tax=Vaccinium darrowii TaxID=229202 RepID=A0ACB7X1A9_9ERIC|nr:hypothetical protein Vadar_014874 [Vaccinium darrowii]
MCPWIERNHRISASTFGSDEGGTLSHDQTEKVAMILKELKSRGRPSEDRTIPLSVIAERTKLTVEDVEYLLMKSLSGLNQISTAVGPPSTTVLVFVVVVGPPSTIVVTGGGSRTQKKVDVSIVASVVSLLLFRWW